MRNGRCSPSRPIEPDVQTNEHPFDGRVYVLILDDLHVAALRSQRVKIAARQFIERNLGANDLMAVIFTGGRSQDAQEFTSNKRLLLNAVDKFMGQKLDSPTIARNREYFRQVDPATRDARIPDPDEQQRVYNTRIDADLAAPGGGVVWRGARTAEDDAADQRRHRLRHLGHHPRARPAVQFRGDDY